MSSHCERLESEHGEWVERNSEQTWLHVTGPEQHRPTRADHGRGAVHDPQAAEKAVEAHNLEEAMGRGG